MKNLLKLLLGIVLLTLILNCSASSDSNQEEDLKELNTLKEEIELLVDSVNCSENTDCDFMAFGSKACGGPQSFLVFSNAIDLSLLQQKVDAYTALEKAYNIKWSISSDCMMVLPPTSVICTDGKCTAVNN